MPDAPNADYGWGRDRLVGWLTNQVLRLASPRYRAMIGGSIRYSREAARDTEDEMTADYAPPPHRTFNAWLYLSSLPDDEGRWRWAWDCNCGLYLTGFENFEVALGSARPHYAEMLGNRQFGGGA